MIAAADVVEAAVVLALIGVCGACVRVSLRGGEGAAGGAVRILATLLLPAIALGFARLYFWPLSLGASVAIAAAQYFGAARDWKAPALRRWAAMVPLAAALVLLAVKAALSVASTPYDIDSNAYHVPMSIEYLQAHATVPAQVMFHPGNAELLDSLGLGALGAVGGQTITEAVVALALVLVAFGLARTIGASRSIAGVAAAATLAVPLVADQLFTAQNDILVAALLLAFVVLWRRSPALSAIAFGLAAGTKFTGALEAAVLLPILWSRRSRNLSWRHAVIAAGIAAPWYIRNAIETGNPLFLGGQTLGFSSTIAAHVPAAARYVVSGIRNYGGLLAVLGIFCVVRLARSAALRHSLAPKLPLLLAAALLLWFVMPNTAETVPGTLDQIRSGWSIRYVLFALVALTVASIVWLARVNANLAIAAATLAVIATCAREFAAGLRIDAGAATFIAPCLVALALLVACGLATSTVRFASFALVAALSVALTAGSGAARIAAIWDQRYEGTTVLGPFAFGPALAFAGVRTARRIATIGLPPLPVMGARFDRYDIADESQLEVAPWWRTIEAEQPQMVIAKDAPGSDVPSPNERFLCASGQYRRAYGASGVRVYAPAGGGSPNK